MNHAVQSKNWNVRVVFSESSNLNDPLWQPFLPHKATTWQVKKGDVVFIAGKDWAYFDTQQIDDSIPIINLIQGIRHTDPTLPHYKNLSRKALRICVSNAVKKALLETGVCKEPITVIQNGISPTPYSFNALTTQDLKNKSWLIVGYKNKKLAKDVALKYAKLGINTDFIDQEIDKADFIKKMNDAAVVVCFPYVFEGFYLTALEAMAMGKIVICPDCKGNQEYCTTQTALMPDFTTRGYVKMAKTLLNYSTAELVTKQNNAFNKAAEFTLEEEQNTFLNFLQSAQTAWRNLKE